MLINYYSKYEILLTKLMKTGRLTKHDKMIMDKLEQWILNDDRIGNIGEYDLF